MFLARLPYSSVLSVSSSASDAGDLTGNDVIFHKITRSRSMTYDCCHDGSFGLAAERLLQQTRQFRLAIRHVRMVVGQRRDHASGRSSDTTQPSERVCVSNAQRRSSLPKREQTLIDVARFAFAHVDCTRTESASRGSERTDSSFGRSNDDAPADVLRASQIDEIEFACEARWVDERESAIDVSNRF